MVTNTVGLDKMDRMDRIEAAIERLLLTQQETARQIKEAGLETNRLIKETGEQMKETDRRMKETEEQMKETDEEINKLIESQRKGFGFLKNSLGHVVELVLLPGLRLKMNDLNHNFFMSSPWKTFYRRDGSILAEVDLFLENGDEVMVAEAKTLFLEDNVKKLIDRVTKLRENEAITGVSGKTIYAAAAGITFTQDARQAIKANGIYLVKIDEDNDRISVEPPVPESCVGKW